jgi:hypothetical protein
MRTIGAAKRPEAKGHRYRVRSPSASHEARQAVLAGAARECSRIWERSRRRSTTAEVTR